MEFCETGEFPVRPVHLSEYLRAHHPAAEAGLRASPGPEAIAVGPEDEDRGLARARLFRSSARYWALARAATQSADRRTALLQARELILAAEESSLLLGDAGRCAAMLALLDRADRLLEPTPSPAERPSAAPTRPAAPAPADLVPSGLPADEPKSPPGATGRSAPADEPKSPPAATEGSAPADEPKPWATAPASGAPVDKPKPPPAATARTAPADEPKSPSAATVGSAPADEPKSPPTATAEGAAVDKPKRSSASTRKGAAKRRAGKRGHGRRS
jgi:hypothetical protein